MYKPLKIQKFLRGGESLSDLKKDPYNLKINADSKGRRIVFKYNQIKTDLSLDISKEARGLILDRQENWRVLSFPFKKFFNYGEDFSEDIDWNSAEVFSKMDGTCATLYYFENEWVMHTLGTVKGEGPVHVDDLLSVPFDGTFSDLFFYAWDKVYGNEKLRDLNEDYIYIFELMTPYNIVVKEHESYKITLLGVRNRNSLNEYSLNKFENDFYTPERYEFDNLNIEKLESTLEEFPPDEEGYVVCDKDFNRIKLKNPDYVLRHKMKDSVVNKKNGVLELVLDEKEDDFLSSFPDIREEVLKIKRYISELVDYLEEKYEEFDGNNVDPDDSEERKEFALKVKEDIPHSMQSYMFKKLTDGGTFEDIIKEDRVGSVSDSLKTIQNTLKNK